MLLYFIHFKILQIIKLRLPPPPPTPSSLLPLPSNNPPPRFPMTPLRASEACHGPIIRQGPFSTRWTPLCSGCLAPMASQWGKGRLMGCTTLKNHISHSKNPLFHLAVHFAKNYFYGDSFCLYCLTCCY